MTTETTPATRLAIFLDRDGTLNVDAGFTHRARDLRLLAGVVPGLARLQKLGFQLLITTNQSGVARGYFSESDMHAFNAALLARLHGEGITIVGVYCCPFHPTEGIGPYRCDSPLRKPQPGMLLQAAAEHGVELKSSFAIGDRTSDVVAGQAAGCRTILLQSASSRRADERQTARPDCVAADLVEAAMWVERFAAASTGVSRRGDCAYPSGTLGGDKPVRTRA